MLNGTGSILRDLRARASPRDVSVHSFRMNWATNWDPRTLLPVERDREQLRHENIGCPYLLARQQWACRAMTVE